MSVSFVGAQGSATTTVTIPTHQVGDLILIFAFRDGSNIAPSTPIAGGTVPTWNLIGTSGANSASSNFRWAVATATNTTSGIWATATELICLVYRGASVGASAGAGASSSTITYPALTLQRTDGSSWVVGVAGHRTATDVEQAPTGMTNRIFSGTEAAGHDTANTVTSWSQQTVTVNALSGHRSWTVELKDKNLRLLADVGTFAVTGVNANVIKDAPKPLTADSGGFSVSGVAANIAALHLLLANQGSILCSGVPAGVLRKAVIGASSGTYTISEKTANLVKRITLTAVKGSLLCNGQDAVLRTSSTDERPVAFKLNVTDPSILAVDPNFISTSQFSIYKKIRIL